MASETETVTLTTDDAEEEIEVSTALVDALNEGGETVPAVVADIAMLGLAQQAHAVVHHSHGEPDDDLAAAEELTMELFEERFGQSYGEMTGHQH
jgi:hypothetical protein